MGWRELARRTPRDEPEKPAIGRASNELEQAASAIVRGEGVQ
jgi:hypothetical protein|tara:strand:- start:18 stop:143 length:126 start_codon:yes stop_codon:yes gene_type:complete